MKPFAFAEELRLFQKGAEHEDHLGGFGNADAFVQNPVVGFLYALEQARVDFAQSPEGAAAFLFDEVVERFGFFIASPGAASFEFHEAAKTVVLHAEAELFGIHPKRRRSSRGR